MLVDTPTLATKAIAGSFYLVLSQILHLLLSKLSSSVCIDIDSLDSEMAFCNCADLQQALSKERAAGTTPRVGVDAEWRPTRLRYATQARSMRIAPNSGGSGIGNGTSTDKVLLLQIATASRAYLFDLQSLLPQQNHTDGRSSNNNQSTLTDAETIAMCQFLRDQIFANRGVVKAGFGLRGDLRFLHESYPGLLVPLENTGNGNAGATPATAIPFALAVVDFAMPYQHIYNGGGGSLRHLCEDVLGSTIDKTQQVSEVSSMLPVSCDKFAGGWMPMQPKKYVADSCVCTYILFLHASHV